jgi:hypothetical protein
MPRKTKSKNNSFKKKGSKPRQKKRAGNKSTTDTELTIQASKPASKKTFWHQLLPDRRISIIALILAAISVFYFLFDRYKAQEKKDDDNFQSGKFDIEPLPENSQSFKTLEAPPTFTSRAIQKDAPPIVGILLDSISLRPTRDPNNPFYPPSGTWISFGKYTRHATISNLVNGIEAEVPFNDPFSKYLGECGVSTIKFAVSNNRLYIACKLYDLKNEDYIGEIEFNHWKVYIPNRLTCWSDEKRLEIRDKQNRIVIAMQYNHPKNAPIPYLTMGGYFINNKSIVVIPNYETTGGRRDCFCFAKKDSNWKIAAAEIIDSLVTVFPDKSF